MVSDMKIEKIHYMGTDHDGPYGNTVHTARTLTMKKLVDGKVSRPGYPELLGTSTDVGGSFHLLKYADMHFASDPCYAWRGGPNQQYYTGRFRAYINSIPDYYNVGANGELSGKAWGAEAYNKMKPTKPNFRLPNALYELRELPGMLRQRFLSNGLSSIGSYWLALKFGWEPLLRDVVSLVQTQMNAQARLEQLLRDNGRPVRRRITLVDNEAVRYDTSSTAYGWLYPILVTQYYAREPRGRQLDTEYDRVWATAQFRYFLPDGPRDVRWRSKMKAAIFGLNPTPAAVYKAIPWSWLIDWFTNVGDLIENAEAGVADRLAAERFYVMRHRVYTRTCTGMGSFFNRDGTTFDVDASSVSRYDSLHRMKGDPFGFATDENQLSGMQLSILGALGLSRLR